MTEDTVPRFAPTVAQLPFFVSGRFPKPDLFGQCSASGITSISASEMLDRVRDLGLGLSSLGLGRGDRVALIADNRPEWVFIDLAIQAIGGVTVPMYPTLSEEQVAFILRDSEAAVAVASTRLLFEKLVAAAAAAPALRTIIVMDAGGDKAPLRPKGDVPLTVLSIDEVAARGHKQLLDNWGVARSFHDAAKAVQPDDIATIVYTSGTTGEPKGVVLTHGNLMSNIVGVSDVVRLGVEDRALSFLPLCHAFERTVVYFYLSHGVTIIFAESFNTIGRDLAQARPTMVTGVPRIFERLHERIVSKGLSQKGAKRAIFKWAIDLASKHGAVLESKAPLSPLMRWQVKIADRLVFEKIRAVLGGRLNFAVSGGAALPAALGRFFYGAGVPILEGYGLTETSPVLSVMPLGAIRFGTVGPALPNVEFKIAPDGEILARGPNIMAGYYRRPADTAEVIRDGWFHTGDIGALDTNGYLRITDRKKAIIVTSAGKNVAPQPIEEAFRAHPLVAEAVLIGEKRPFMTLLIVPELQELATRLKWASPDPPEGFTTRDDVRGLFEDIIDSVNVHLAQYEHVKRFALLPRALSADAGELTPTLKVKRRVVEEKYAPLIQQMYEL